MESLFYFCGLYPFEHGARTSTRVIIQCAIVLIKMFIILLLCSNWRSPPFSILARLILWRNKIVLIPTVIIKGINIISTNLCVHLVYHSLAFWICNSLSESKQLVVGTLLHYLVEELFTELTMSMEKVNKVEFTRTISSAKYACSYTAVSYGKTLKVLCQIGIIVQQFSHQSRHINPSIRLTNYEKLM